MSGLLSSFINRHSKYSSKRKGKKHNLNLPIQRPQFQQPPSPASFVSPEIVDINEKLPARMIASHSPFLQDEVVSYESLDASYEDTLPRGNNLRLLPQLELNIHSEPMTDWFARDTMRIGVIEALGGKYDTLKKSSSASGRGLGTDDARLSRETYDSDEVSQPNETTNHTNTVSTEELLLQSVRKPTPTPIRIPSGVMRGTNAELRRSAHIDPHNDVVIAVITNESHPDSPSSPDNISATSGTTLARALIANSFVLSNDFRGSRYRSGTSSGGTRQDSATLPRGDYPFLNSPYWRDKRISGGDIVLSPEPGQNSAVPPVPRIPSPSNRWLKRSKSARNSLVIASEKGRRSGADLSRHASSSPRLSASDPIPPVTRPLSLSGPTTSEHLASRRISLIIEVPSPEPSTSSATFRGGTKSPNDGRVSSAGLSPLNSRHCSGKAPSECDVTSSSPNTPTHTRKQRSHSDAHSDASLSPNFSEGATNILEKDTFTPAANGQSSPSQLALESGAFPDVPTLESGASTNTPTPYRRAKRASKRRKSGKIVYKTNTSSIAAGKDLVDWVQRKDSDTHRHPPSLDISKVKLLLPIGERPGSIHVPQTPLTAVSVPTSGSPLRLTPGIRVSATPSAASNARFLSPLETPAESPDVLDGMLAPLSRGNPTRHRSVGPERGSSQNNTIATESVHQTFPETPNTSSPLWSASTAAGSPGGLVKPSHSPSSLLPFTPGYPIRSAPLSGTMQASQFSLAQKALLFKATTAAGDKPTTGTSKLKTVTEVTEAHRSVVLSPVSPLRPSYNKQPSVEMLPENVDTPTHRSKPLPLQPPITPTSPLLPPLRAQNVRSQLSPMLRPLPNISQASHSPTLTSQSASPQSARSVSPLRAPSPPLSTHKPLPGHASSPKKSAFTTSASAAPTADDSAHSPLNSDSAQSLTQTSMPLKLGRLSEAETMHSYTLSFIAPPPYQAVVNNGRLSSITPNAGGQGNDTSTQLSDQASAVPETNINPPTFTIRSANGRAARPRPPLPVGPRQPIAGQIFAVGSYAALRERNGSVTSIGSSMNGGSGGNRILDGWRTLVAQSLSPKFQVPAPKFRGYTLEAAQWTFTSQQLQAIVSRAIKQSAKASSVRLLQPETLDTEIPAETHRLEMQEMDLKNRYKILARKRWALLRSLTAYVDGLEEADSVIALRALEELTEVTFTLDQLAEELHSVTQQLAHLKSLVHIHSASALAMALRKLNTSFLKQLTENQMLREQVKTMEAERDEAWKQAEDVAQEYDDLMDKSRSLNYPRNQRYSQVTAVRKSSIFVSRAGLRSPARRSSQRSSGRRSSQQSLGSSSGYRGSMTAPLASAENVPPLPPMPHQITVLTADISNRTSTAVSSPTPPSVSEEMLKAQEELYDLLGFPKGDVRRHHARSRSVTYPTRHSRHTSINMKSPCPRPVSEINTGFMISSVPGSAKLSRLYNGTDNSNVMLATAMSVMCG